MSQWLVTQGDNQFTVDGLGELEGLAQRGELRAGDLIQPPGAADWIYAVEIPELQAVLDQGAGGDDELEAYLSGRKRAGQVMTAAVAAVLVAIIVAGGAVMFTYMQRLPQTNAVLIGDGGMTYTQMLVTGDEVVLVSDPEPGARTIQALAKDEKLDLLAKRGDFYRARTRHGAEGWVRHDQVIPMYKFGGSEVLAEFDPLYNPDRYVEVANASWQQLPDQAADQITVFQFMLRNRAAYPMTNIVLLATIKDAKGHELEQVEIPIEGQIPAEGLSMVGTLKPDARSDEPVRLLTQYTLDALAEADPDLQLRYSGGVEVKMGTQDFTQANIDILELRAIPDAPTETARR